ncbi:hypothetical protein [Burkholderia ubonensis]|uniref:hypothetical protein n=1 Tax=Burkholderia ubonensis TaxID=101571 RepID=UPI0012FC72E8|nr:hypothetical protein [Burkholderia ubonensis]
MSIKPYDAAVRINANHVTPTRAAAPMLAVVRVPHAICLIAFIGHDAMRKRIALDSRRRIGQRRDSHRENDNPKLH